MEPDNVLLKALQPGDTIAYEGNGLLMKRSVTRVTDTISIENCGFYFAKSDGFARNGKGVPYKNWRIYPITPKVEAWMRHKELATKTTFYMQVASGSLENLSDEQLLQILQILDPLVSVTARENAGWK